MKLRRLAAAVFTLALLLSAAGCKAGTGDDVPVFGRQYTYEKEGCGGSFTISIREDGTFSYYEGLLSSYFGMGTWSLEGSVLTLSDSDETGYPFVNRFRVEQGDLIFLAEGSTNFLYVKVADGEAFHGAPLSS